MVKAQDQPHNDRYGAPSSTSLQEHTQSQLIQVVEQPVEFVQSLELVQTMVCAVVSTVSCLRGLFPVECFRIHHFDVESPTYSYKDFKQATEGNSMIVESGCRRLDRRYIPWDIIVPGKNAGADKLLNWIELGVTDAVSHKYLNTLQMSIYDGEICLSKRIEVYMMSFSYSEEGVQMALQLSSAHDLQSRAMKTVSDVKQELRFLVHRLATHIGGFPLLPSQSMVNMHFTYNETCPHEYQPPGFATCQDHGLILKKDQGALVGALNPGPHRVDLRVFLNEDMVEIPESPNPPNVVTMRRSATGSRLSSTVSNRGGKKCVYEAIEEINIPTLATLHQTQDQYRHASIISNSTSNFDTQEMAQLVAIANMARLRSTDEGLQDTQVLESSESKRHVRYGTIDLDAESTKIAGSSTQGSPSTLGCRRSPGQATLRSTMAAVLENITVRPRPQKREGTAGNGDRQVKFPKMSKARSPFVTASLRE